VWTSSGTTGTPGYFVHDPDAIAVYDALEAQRFRGLLSPTDLMRQLMEGDRYAMVAATDGHFAGVSTVERMRHWAPWMADAVRAFSLLQPCGQLLTQLNAYRPTILATYPTAAEMLAEHQEAGSTAAAATGNLDRRRGSFGADAAARSACVRLPRAQCLWRLRVPADRLGVSAPAVACQFGLGDSRTGRP
jgi:phenylacetate-coenzyme A ligase PaaK-like adenylate-forming protein